MASANYDSRQIAELGEAIFAEQIASHLRDGDRGKYVVLDVETGAWEMDPSDVRATQRILKRFPRATLYGLRVGHPSAYRLGGRFSATHS